jgi:hypothetical protein
MGAIERLMGEVALRIGGLSKDKLGVLEANATIDSLGEAAALHNLRARMQAAGVIDLETSMWLYRRLPLESGGPDDVVTGFPVGVTLVERIVVLKVLAELAEAERAARAS